MAESFAWVIVYSLKCDEPQHDRKAFAKLRYSDPDADEFEFHNEGTATEARVAARRQGWTIRRDGTVACPMCKAKRRGRPAPPSPQMLVGAEERSWRPWIDMPIGDQRNIVREVCSEDGRTALAYWTGKIMALAPISDDPVELPFKVWGQRPPQADTPAPAEHVMAGNDTAILHSEATPEGGVIRLAKWPEGYVLWYHGEIAWRSWLDKPQHISVTLSADTKPVQDAIAAAQHVLGADLIAKIAESRLAKAEAEALEENVAALEAAKARGRQLAGDQPGALVEAMAEVAAEGAKAYLSAIRALKSGGANG